MVHPPGFRTSKSLPSSPLKPLGITGTCSNSFPVAHKVPFGDTPYVKAKYVQLVEKDPGKAIPLFWAAINAGDRVDSALKDMAIVMRQQNRAEEAIEAIKSFRSQCSDQAQESLDNILLDLYKRCGRLDDQIAIFRHKLFLIQQGVAFNGKRTKTARSHGKKFQLSVDQEATRLLGNLGWALMQQNNYIEAEDAYRRALLIASDNNKMCNLGICLMRQGKITEAKETLQQVILNGPRGVDSHLKAFERAQQMLRHLESDAMDKGGDMVEQGHLFEAILGSSIWQPQPCKKPGLYSILKPQEHFADQNITLSSINSQPVVPPQRSTRPGVIPLTNSLNIGAPPFYSSNLVRDPTRTRLSGNLAGLKRARPNNAEYLLREELETKMKSAFEQSGNAERCSQVIENHKWDELLPDTKAFEDAIFAVEANNSGTYRRKLNKRLRVFEDITLSKSPSA